MLDCCIYSNAQFGVHETIQSRVLAVHTYIQLYKKPFEQVGASLLVALRTCIQAHAIFVATTTAVCHPLLYVDVERMLTQIGENANLYEALL